MKDLIIFAVCYYLISHYLFSGNKLFTTDSTPHTVRYSVEGSARGASLTYENAEGGTEQKDVSIPWQQSFSMKEGDYVYISAQNMFGDDGSITTRIIVDGKEFKKSSSSGAYKISDVSGTCCN